MHLSIVLNRLICSINGRERLPRWNKRSLQLTLSLRAPRYNGHPDNTDKAYNPGKKIDYRYLTEKNSCSYGLSLPRTLAQGPYGVRGYKRSSLYYEY